MVIFLYNMIAFYANNGNERYFLAVDMILVAVSGFHSSLLAIVQAQLAKLAFSGRDIVSTQQIESNQISNVKSLSKLN